jgi:hypothetical protein
MGYCWPRKGASKGSRGASRSVSSKRKGNQVPRKEGRKEGREGGREVTKPHPCDVAKILCMHTFTQLSNKEILALTTMYLNLDNSESSEIRKSKRNTEGFHS